jgi:hypothetical protein
MSEMSEEVDALLRALEETLLDPAVRRDRARVEALLAEEFEEFGSSGRVWTREQILDLLASEDYERPSMEDFRCAVIAKNVALVTYRSVRTDAASGLNASVLRSSLWVKDAQGWRMRFHQGTRMD